MKYFLHVLVMGMLFSLHAFSQSVTLSYKTGLTDNGCNLFNVANPITISGIQHYPVAGGVGFYHTDEAIYLKCQSGNTRATMLGTAYAIKYPFKEGYTYNIKVQSWQLDLPATGQVNLSFSMIDQLPDPNTTKPDLCGPVDEDKWYDLANTVINQIPLDTNKSTNRDVGTFLMNQNHNYLTLVAWMNPSGTLNLTSSYIRQITITETPPTYALTPASVPKVCGTALSQTFTITDVHNSGNVSSYEWDLGSDNNGWLYNGAAAPRLITTTSPSLSLSAADACTAALSNIVVRVTRPNGIFTSNTSVVSITAPQLSISGPTELCTTGNYTIENLPCNASVAWSTTYINYVNLLPSGNAVTLEKIAPGNIVLKATVTNLCSSDTLYVTKDVKVSGVPDNPLLGTFTTGGYTKGIETCNVLTGQFASGKYNGFVSFNAPTVDNVTWTYLGGSSGAANILLPSSDGKSAEIRIYPSGGYGAWRVSASNACGSSSGNFGFWANKTCPAERIAVQPDAGNTATNVPSNGITLSPNPASSQITIAIDKNKATITAPNNTDDKITGIKIYDVLGRLRKNQRYNRVSNVNVTVNDLASGLYFVEIIMGNSSVKRNLNIKR